MRVAVVGGTGTLGRRIVREVSGRGADVVVLSRTPRSAGADHRRVDLTTGEGLDAALDGVDVVVDAANGPPSGRAAATLVDGTRRLLDAGPRAGVAHHVAISIVGCEKVPTRYYGVKARQEGLVAAHPGGWSIVRATQFHELLAYMFGSVARYRAIPFVRGSLAPVDTGAVATLAVDVALAEPLGGRVDIAGPEERRVADLARTYRRATGARAVLLPVPLAPRVGRAVRAGALARAESPHRGTTTFGQWLATR